MDENVIIRFQLPTNLEGDTVMLAIPPDGALTLALALMSCVKELRANELGFLFPALDPKSGN